MAGETVLNGRYQLVAQQGSGGMSVIYKAIDRALGRTVAVKILRPSLISDPTFLEKFRAEARAVANLSHPNIVTVYDVGSDGPTHYIVMEIVEGQDLKKVIKTAGTLPIDRAVDLAIQICAGVGYAHRSGLVHADVKPQNILLTAADVVKVTDFGIAQALSDTQPAQRADVVWGSPHYFAPEQARGEPPAPQADVYAIGIVVFEMLTGRLPYAGANQQELAMAHIREPIPSISDVNPAVPERLSKMVYRAMAKDPRDRYRDADQFGNVLLQFRDRARENTAVNPNVPAEPPRAATPRPVSNEVTAKYSAAPNAPEPYDPRKQQASIPAPQRPVAQAPQPFQQNYVPPAPQYPQPAQQQYPQAAPQYPTQAQQGYPQPQQGYPQATYQGDSGAYAAQYNSQPIYTEDDEGADYVTIMLAILAVLAVGGLIVLWIVVLSAVAA
jgi:eukaryotic-like serine/threonine-protein kinase